MSLELFKQLVFVLCTQFAPQEKFPAPTLEDSQLMCIDHYVNCAVKDGGKILSQKQFEKECVK
jgi:hypothetical protein